MTEQTVRAIEIAQHELDIARRDYKRSGPTHEAAMKCERALERLNALLALPSNK